MSDKQMTAVEWLIQQLSKEWQLEERDLYLIEQAKEMEKQQIIDFAEDYELYESDKYPKKSFEQYYNETYKND